MPSTAQIPTPGPWTITDGLRQEANYGLIGPVDGHPVCGTTGYYGAVQTTANARLIAACPTMRDYIARKAAEGDADAARILASI